ncbi:MAG: RNA pseudouridine synthase [Pseudomonadales bacterium]|nr:RNA pseudouridine synthase [Pseudomonadales bacterium]
MIRILYRDQHLVALDKPADLALLADRSGAPCLWDGLPGLLGARPYLVHRLDKGTSGVLLVALDRQTQSALTRAFTQRQIDKYYLAWVAGRLDAAGTQIIDLPLKPGRKSRYRVAGARDAIVRDRRGWHIDAADPEGHPSLTRLRVLAHDGDRTLVLLAPVTGRTHQLRVHLAWIGHPILGDSLYGKPGTAQQAAPRLLLHCHKLVVRGRGMFRAAPSDAWPPVRRGS